MPTSGVSRYPYYTAPTIPKPYTPTYTAPTYAPPPPPPPSYTLPPPPAIPALPTAPTNPFPALPPEILALLTQSKTAALAGLDQYAKASQGQLLGDLFGRNMQQSSNAIDRTNALSNQLGVSRAQIEADAANRQMGAMQYGGQYGLNSYQSAVQALLGQGSLAQQGYATQTGNTLQQQGLSQNYQLQQQQLQQQMLQQLLDYLMRQSVMGGTSSLGGLSGGGGGYSGGGYGGPSAGVAGPGVIPGSGYPNTQDPQQQLWQLLMQYLQGALG